jgi:hypothetical protein
MLSCRGRGATRRFTNFLQSREPSRKRLDHRYRIVDARLSQAREVSHNLASALLHETQQDITQYSTVFDLTNLEVKIYQRHQFDRGVTIHLSEGLARGPRATEIRTLFKHAP